jgi:hypothetical protein
MGIDLIRTWHLRFDFMLDKRDLGFSNKLIAPCGINCGVCLEYLREKNQDFISYNGSTIPGAAE